VAQVEHLWWWAVYRHDHPDDNHVSVGPADAATSLWLGTTPQPVRVHVQYAHQGNQL